MATPLQAKPTGSIVVDANVLIAIVCNEANRVSVAHKELSHYASLGFGLYAPGVVVAECLYVICGKLNNGTLTPTAYQTAVNSFTAMMASILPPPDGDKCLIERAAQINDGYGCSRSADAIYIALAEKLTAINTTLLLTFDKELPKQAAKNSPLIVVKVL
jgi:predicted nucleic acid-binding protein